MTAGTKNQEKSFFTKVAEFIPQVKQEVSKVTWASRREVVLTTVVVFVFAMIAACYFLLVDQVVYRLIQWILKLG